MAGPTRLELATSGVTGRRSNQLNYDPASRNRLLPEQCAVITALQQAFNRTGRVPRSREKMVGGGRLELPTLGL